MIALLISYLFVGIGLLYISEFKPGTGLLARFLVMFLWPLVLLAIWNSYLKGDRFYIEKEGKIVWERTLRR